MHKNKALHNEFIRTSAAMLQEFEKKSWEELEQEIYEYLDSVKSKSSTLEGRAKEYFLNS